MFKVALCTSTKLLLGCLAIVYLSSSRNTLCVAFLLANKAKVQPLSNLVCKVMRSVCEPGHCVVLSRTRPKPLLCVIYLIAHTGRPQMTLQTHSAVYQSRANLSLSPCGGLFYFWSQHTSVLLLAIWNLRLSETIKGGVPSISDCSQVAS